MPKIRLQHLTGTADEIKDLQAAFESAPGFSMRTTGALPGKSDAETAITALPPNKSLEDKFIFNIFAETKLVGCADVIRGYPDPQTAWIGLLLINESFHSQGFGKAAYAELESQIKAWTGIKRIRLSVVATNDRAVPFWQKMGFADTGVRKPYRHGEIESEIIIMEKASV